MSKEYEIVVVGGGLAGLSAAYHAAVRGAEVACLESAGVYGGLIVNVSALDDIPGAGQPGAAFADTMMQRARDAGVTFVATQATALSAGGSGIAVATGQGDFNARRVILATGAAQRRLGVPGERELEHRGVSTCAWCDGGLFRGKRVAVVGGGDSALQATLHLATLCSGVDVIVRGEELRARRSYVMAAADNPAVAFHWATSVASIDGADAVSGLTVQSPEGTAKLPCAGLFLYAGLTPNSQFLPAEIARDESGAVVTDGRGRTSVAGIFAVGALRSGYDGAGVNALSDGASAAIAATAELAS
jgi:thioredoxin reductase (NADPH)